MPEIRLQFVAAPGLSSWLIRWYGGVHLWSHVDAALPDGQLLGARSDAVGGKPPGVHIRAPDYERFLRREIVPLRCSAEEALQFWRLLRSQLGKPYSDETILGFALGRDLRDFRGWICSALQLWAGCRSGVVPPSLARFDRVTTPDDLYLVARAIAAEREDRG